jgi:hypothetical protein
MSRPLTYDYSAIATLSETVLDRLVRAHLQDGTIAETISGDFNTGDILPQNVAGTLHVLLSTISVEFGTGSRNSIWIVLDIHTVLSFPAPPPVGVPFADSDWLQGRILIRIPLLSEGSRLSPDLDSVQANDIQIEDTTSNNDDLRDLAPLLVPLSLPALLQTAGIRQLQLDLGFNVSSLMADGVDIAVLDGPAPADRDELALALYETSRQPETRGSVDALQSPLLRSGKTLGVRVSSETLQAMIERELDREYMHCDVTLDDPWRTAPSQYRVAWTHLGNPDQNFLHVLRDGQRANLRGCTVQCLRTGRQIGFETNSSGEGITETGSKYIPLRDLRKGDILRFRSKYKYDHDADIRIYRPEFQLQDGHIKVSGKVVKDVACYDDVTINYDSKVYVIVDPATGAVSVDAEETDIDLPWFVDAGLFFMKLGVYALTGPIGGLIIGSYEDSSAESLEQGVQRKAGLLLPGLGRQGKLSLFWEDIEIKSEGFLLHGQLEAGWLHRAGRALGLEATLERDGNDWTKLAIWGDGSNARVWSTVPAHHDILAIVALKSGPPFEELDSSMLANLTEGETKSFIPLPGPDVEGIVLAVRTTQGRYAKIRIDRSKQKGTWVLRYVTYMRREPSVEIIGNLANDQGWTRYWGTFRIKTTRVYLGHGAIVDWQYTGPGKMTLDADNAAKLEILEADIPEGLAIFSGLLQVRVRDIFGRDVSAELELVGITKDFGMFYKWFRDEWPRPLPVPPDPSKPIPVPPRPADELVEWLRGSDPVAQKLVRVVGWIRAAERDGLPVSAALQSLSSAMTLGGGPEG